MANQNQRIANFIERNFELIIAANDTYSDHHIIDNLWKNPAAIEVLLRNQERIGGINYEFLSANPSDTAMDILLANTNEINFENLSMNPNNRALDHLMAHRNHIALASFCKNPNPRALRYLQRNNLRLDWYNLSINSSAISLLNENRNNIKLYQLSRNPSAVSTTRRGNRVQLNWLVNRRGTRPVDIHWVSYNPAAFDYVVQHVEQIDNWYGLSSNPKAIELLEANLDSVHWLGVAKNCYWCQYQHAALLQ